ncbi:hypothetical protein DFH09DRAFT_1068897 [Mycena vulgaris]|nr:hypothetical protein DFH09DRAFT_1068897 [Mycena vulgaris]
MSGALRWIVMGFSVVQWMSGSRNIRWNPADINNVAEREKGTRLGGGEILILMVPSMSEMHIRPCDLKSTYVMMFGRVQKRTIVAVQYMFRVYGAGHLAAATCVPFDFLYKSVRQISI